MAFDGYYEKKWFPYTMPISDIYGLRAAFNLIAGDKTLYERHARIGSATRAAVKEAGLKLHLQSGYSNTVTVFDIPECTDAKSILDEMRTKYNIMLAGSFDELSGKVIRIRTHGRKCKIRTYGSCFRSTLRYPDRSWGNASGKSCGSVFETLQGVSGLICLNRLTP